MSNVVIVVIHTDEVGVFSLCLHGFLPGALVFPNFKTCTLGVSLISILAKVLA